VFAFVALGIQRAMRKRHIIFPHYLINGTDCVKRSHNTKCVLIFSISFARNLSRSKKN